jgi:uroporphyrinogen decarboxylase
MSRLLVPVVYEHAARFLRKSPGEVSVDGSLIYQAHKAAYLNYRHSPITVGIDIYNLEAEAYGAVVGSVEGNEVPSIRIPLCNSVNEINSLDFFNPRRDGRFSIFTDAALKLQEEFPETSVKMPVSGPFSIASNLTGFENLLVAVLTDPESVRSALKHLAEGQMHLMEYYGKKGLHVTVFESAAAPPLVSPEAFRDILKPIIFRMINEAAGLFGDAPAFILGGDTAPIAGDLAASGASFLICPAETDQRLFLKNLGSSDITVRCNLPAELVERGSDDEIFREMKHLTDLMGHRPNTLIGTGVLSYDVEESRVAHINSLFHEISLTG